MKNLLTIIISIPLLCIGGFIFYLENSIDKVMTKAEQEKLWLMIEEAPPLPNLFYKTMEKHHPEYFTLGSYKAKTKKLYNILLGKRYHSISCRSWEVRPISYRRLSDRYTIGNVFARWIIALEIEDRFTQKECYTYNMSVMGFGSNTHGVREASKTFYQKDVEELTEREILELHIILEAPSYYSPVYHRDRIDATMKKYKLTK